MTVVTSASGLIAFSLVSRRLIEVNWCTIEISGIPTLKLSLECKSDSLFEAAINLGATAGRTNIAT